MTYSIQISYRDENNGGGAFYDHYCLQRITMMHTDISKHTQQSTVSLESYVRTNARGLSYGVDTDEGKIIPKVASHQRDEMGLLVVPGRARDTIDKRPAVYKQRLSHEEELLKEAKLIGRPVLAICAGAWTLWQSFGGATRNCVEHCSRRMPAIIQNGQLGYNVQIHDVKVNEGTLLAGIVKGKYRFSVNSVHWKVADETTDLPNNLRVSALSQQNDGIAPKSADREGPMKPENNVIEAFETANGVPMMGIQWHPEAYNSDVTQHAIIKFLALAGIAFTNKRKVLREIKEYAKQLSGSDLFSPSRIKNSSPYAGELQQFSALSLE